MRTLSLAAEVLTNGYAIVPDVLSVPQVDQLVTSLIQVSESASTRKRTGIFAVRNLLDQCEAVQSLASSLAVRSLVEAVLGPEAIPVRGILFDKIPGANWKVPWHQDVTIAVDNQLDAEGYGPWSTKAGVLHVQPPAAILESMISVRLHLDDCGAENGALRVLPGSHQQGRIPEADIEPTRTRIREQVCVLSRGGALLMRPLLLHASSPATVPGHRRVIHLDFSSAKLPDGMHWSSEATA